MSERIREQLSALMDGELPVAERDLLLRRVTSDADLRAWWGRQHRAREVLRHEASPRMEVDLAARVMAELDGDAGYVGVAVKPAGGMHSAWWKPVAGLAVAASVATVAVFGVQRLQVEEEAPSMVAERLPSESGVPLWGGQRNADITRVVADESDRGISDPRLDAYFASHAEQALTMDSAGWLPYSRLVGQGGDGDPRFRADR